jgi:hypothetical protein
MTAPAGFRGDGGGRDGIGQGELFEPPPFSPTYPNPSSLEGRALSMLLAERAIHSAQLALDAGDSRMAFAFAAAAVAAMDCDSGNGIGDMDEIPEALGVLLARIAVAD